MPPEASRRNPNAYLLSLLWNRRRIVISAPTREEADALFADFRIFMPRYRQLVLCGDVPKEATFLSGAKTVTGDDLEALVTGFLQSFEEEEMGAPPIQIAFFHPPAAVIAGFQQSLDRGWIATTSLGKDELEAGGVRIEATLELEAGAIYVLDAAEESVELEELIFEQTRDASRQVQQYYIQVNQSQVYLAFQALRDEIQNADNLTHASILESFGIRQKTLEKIITIGRRDHRLDLAPYIKDTPPNVLAFLREVSHLKTVDVTAVFEGKVLDGYAKFRDVIFPSRYFLEIADLAGLTEPAIGAFRMLEANLESHHLLIYRGDHLYAFLIDAQENPFRFRIEIERMLAGHGMNLGLKKG